MSETQDSQHNASNPTRGGWTIPFLCAGIAVVAACAIIPQTDENHRLAYECLKLKQDLDYLQRQADMGDEFVRRVGEDPVLAERIAQRQLKVVRAGTRVLELAGEDLQTMSPFGLVSVPPPPMPEFRPRGGKLADVCREPRKRLYLIGGGLMLIAIGLVLGNNPR